jgi:hypothetical protein
MKNYMNKEERQTIEVGIVAMSRLGDLVEFKPENMAPEERKYLKSSITFFHKYLEAALARTGEGMAMIKDVKQQELRMIYKSIAKPDEKTVEMRMDDLYDLAELTTAGYCTRCTDAGKDCKIKQILLELGIPESGNDPSCPYKQ